MHTFPGESEMRSAIKKGLTLEQTPESPPQSPSAEEEVCTKVQVSSSLTKFELKLFDKEPELVCIAQVAKFARNTILLCKLESQNITVAVV